MGAGVTKGGTSRMVAVEVSEVMGMFQRSRFVVSSELVWVDVILSRVLLADCL